MTFATRLQAFIDELEQTFTYPEVIKAFMIQLAASSAMSSLKTGENLDALLDAICANLRRTAHRCLQLELSRRN